MIFQNREGSYFWTTWDFSWRTRRVSSVALLAVVGRVLRRMTCSSRVWRAQTETKGGAKGLEQRLFLRWGVDCWWNSEGWWCWEGVKVRAVLCLWVSGVRQGLNCRTDICLKLIIKILAEDRPAGCAGEWVWGERKLKRSGIDLALVFFEESRGVLLVLGGRPEPLRLAVLLLEVVLKDAVHDALLLGEFGRQGGPGGFVVGVGVGPAAAGLGVEVEGVGLVEVGGADDAEREGVRLDQLDLAVAVDLVQPQELELVGLLRFAAAALHLLLREHVAVQALLPARAAAGLGARVREGGEFGEDEVVDASAARVLPQVDVVVLLQHRRSHWQRERARLGRELAGQPQVALQRPLALHQQNQIYGQPPPLRSPNIPLPATPQSSNHQLKLYHGWLKTIIINYSADAGRRPGSRQQPEKPQSANLLYLRLEPVPEAHRPPHFAAHSRGRRNACTPPTASSPQEQTHPEGNQRKVRPQEIRTETPEPRPISPAHPPQPTPQTHARPPLPVQKRTSSLYLQAEAQRQRALASARGGRVSAAAGEAVAEERPLPARPAGAPGDPQAEAAPSGSECETESRRGERADRAGNSRNQAQHRSRVQAQFHRLLAGGGALPAHHSRPPLTLPHIFLYSADASLADDGWAFCIILYIMSREAQEQEIERSQRKLNELYRARKEIVEGMKQVRRKQRLSSDRTRLPQHTSREALPSAEDLRSHQSGQSLDHPHLDTQQEEIKRVVEAHSGLRERNRRLLGGLNKHLQKAESRLSEESAKARSKQSIEERVVLREREQAEEFEAARRREAEAELERLAVAKHHNSKEMLATENIILKNKFIAYVSDLEQHLFTQTLPSLPWKPSSLPEPLLKLQQTARERLQKTAEQVLQQVSSYSQSFDFHSYRMENEREFYANYLDNYFASKLTFIATTTQPSLLWLPHTHNRNTTQQLQASQEAAQQLRTTLTQECDAFYKRFEKEAAIIDEHSDASESDH